MIAYGMLYAIAIGVPIFAAVTIGSGVLQRQGRAQRGAWLFALLLALALPVFLLASPEAEPATVQNTTVVSVAERGLVGLPSVVAVPSPPPVTVPIARSTLGVDEALLGLWLLASGFLALRWIVAGVRLDRMTRSLTRDTVDGIPVSLTADLGPAVAGLLNPKILAPAWLFEMPASQRSLVLLHEAEHVRARDPWLLFLSRLARVVVPWNPIVWFLSFRLVRAIELDCDRRVLRSRPDVGTYGSTLLSVSSRTPGPIAPAAAFARPDGPLRQRILAMTTPPRTLSVLGLLTALTFGVLLIVGVFEVPIPTLRFQVDVESAAPAAADSPDKVADVGEVGAVEGQVTDGGSDRPLQYVQVFVAGTGVGTLTDETGSYHLPDVPVGDRRIVAEYIGHERTERTVSVRADDRLDVDFELRQIAIEVPGLVVSETDAVGAASSEPLIYVDGVRIANPRTPALPYVQGLAPEDIDRVEIIKGGAAEALFGEEASGGVVQIFTKQTAGTTSSPNDEESSPLIRMRSESGRPIFTPFSVAPSVQNQEEIQRAIIEAYPAELREDGIGGTVQVYFFIDEEGAVQDYRIDESSGHPALDDAALSVASTYRFSPALNRDQPVAVWVAFPITFLQMR